MPIQQEIHDIQDSIEQTTYESFLFETNNSNIRIKH